MDRDPSHEAEEERSIMQKTIEFDDILVETIEDVLENIFDKQTAITILQFINEKNAIKIDARIQSFSDSLRKILGNGATIVEDLILENLYSKLGAELKWRKDYAFTDYIRVLRKETRIQRQLGQ
jgi:cystathionine beta-lyase family protein involved in aluminum resistance